MAEQLVELNKSETLDLAQERIVGTLNGSPVYEKWYTGTINITSSGQTTIVDSDTTKKFILNAGSVKFANGDIMMCSPYQEPTNNRRYSVTQTSSGLQIYYFDVNSLLQGTATYTVCAQYTK